MVLYMWMNVGSFGWIVLFGVGRGSDKIGDYGGLQRKDGFLGVCLGVCVLWVGGVGGVGGFLGKVDLLWCGWEGGVYLLV